MNVNIHFFGMIAEAINSSFLLIENYEGTTLGDLKKDLLAIFPQLERYNFQMALDKKLASPQTQLKPVSEVAILPPFAGG